MFAAIGRFSVRHRWSIILAWIVGAFVVVSMLPSLSSVEKSSGSNFLPSDAPSVVAGKLNATFGSTTVTTLVAATRGGELTPADNAVIDRVEQAMKSIPHVSAVVDQEAPPTTGPGGHWWRSISHNRLPASDLSP